MHRRQELEGNAGPIMLQCRMQLVSAGSPHAWKKPHRAWEAVSKFILQIATRGSERANYNSCLKNYRPRHLYAMPALASSRVFIQ
jgi:hypothetical protein